MRRQNTSRMFLVGLTLCAFGSMTESVKGQEAPRVLAQANSPGWITVSWEHTGEDVYYFVIERQNSPYTDNASSVTAGDPLMFAGSSSSNPSNRHS